LYWFDPDEEGRLPLLSAFFEPSQHPPPPPFSLIIYMGSLAIMSSGENKYYLDMLTQY
jgi:hypothetical protein